MFLDTKVAIFGFSQDRNASWNFKLDATGESSVKLTTHTHGFVSISPQSMEEILIDSRDVQSGADRLLNEIRRRSSRIPAYVILEARHFVITWLSENWKALAPLRRRKRSAARRKTRAEKSRVPNTHRDPAA